MRQQRPERRPNRSQPDEQRGGGASKAYSLSKSDLESLLEGMKTAEGACKNCSGGNAGGKRGPAGEAQSELNDLLGNGTEKRTGSAGDAKPGRGGIQRGPGVAPLPLSDSPTDLATRKPESLEAGRPDPRSPR